MPAVVVAAASRDAWRKSRRFMETPLELLLGPYIALAASKVKIWRTASQKDANNARYPRIDRLPGSPTP
jgi:hypothetical protein